MTSSQGGGAAGGGAAVGGAAVGGAGAEAIGGATIRAAGGPGDKARRKPTHGRLPYRSGMIISAIGIGVAVCGLAFRGVLRLDGDAIINVPAIVPDWFLTGGLRIVADAELSDPRVLFAGVGLTLLLVGAVQLLNDFMNRDVLSAGVDSMEPATPVTAGSGS